MIGVERGKKRLKVPSLMRFVGDNPGFDSLIISPFEDEENKCHLTFIETRYSSASSSSFENLAAYNAKFGATAKLLAALKESLRKENMTLTWHYVYALYRKVNFTRKDIHENTILLDKEGLRVFYGPSLSVTGML